MWVSISGFVGKYEVSKEGFVRNARTLHGKFKQAGGWRWKFEN
jgi:hypothetical protein